MIDCLFPLRQIQKTMICCINVSSFSVSGSDSNDNPDVPTFQHQKHVVAITRISDKIRMRGSQSWHIPISLYVLVKELEESWSKNLI